MKKQTLITTFIFIFLLGAAASIFAQTGAGKPFDARNPQD